MTIDGLVIIIFLCLSFGFVGWTIGQLTPFGLRILRRREKAEKDGHLCRERN